MFKLIFAGLFATIGAAIFALVMMFISVNNRDATLIKSNR